MDKPRSTATRPSFRSVSSLDQPYSSSLKLQPAFMDDLALTDLALGNLVHDSSASNSICGSYTGPFSNAYSKPSGYENISTAFSSSAIRNQNAPNYGMQASFPKLDFDLSQIESRYRPTFDTTGLLSSSDRNKRLDNDNYRSLEGSTQIYGTVLSTRPISTKAAGPPVQISDSRVQGWREFGSGEAQERARQKFRSPRNVKGNKSPNNMNRSLSRLDHLSVFNNKVLDVDTDDYQGDYEDEQSLRKNARSADKSHNRLDHHEAMIRELKEGMEGMEKQHKVTVGAYEQELSALHQQVSTMRTEYDKLQRRYRKRATSRDGKSMTSEGGAEGRVIGSEGRGIGEIDSNDVRRLLDRLEEYRQRAEDWDTERRSLIRQCESIRCENQSINQKYELSVQQFNQVHSQLNISQSQLSSCKAELSTCQIQLNSCQSQLSSCQSELSSFNDRKMDELDRLERERKNQIQDYQSQLSSSQNTNSRQEAQLTRLKLLLDDALQSQKRVLKEKEQTELELRKANQTLRRVQDGRTIDGLSDSDKSERQENHSAESKQLTEQLQELKQQIDEQNKLIKKFEEKENILKEELAHVKNQQGRVVEGDECRNVVEQGIELGDNEEEKISKEQLQEQLRQTQQMLANKEQLLQGMYAELQELKSARIIPSHSSSSSHGHSFHHHHQQQQHNLESGQRNSNAASVDTGLRPPRRRRGLGDPEEVLSNQRLTNTIAFPRNMPSQNQLYAGNRRWDQRMGSDELIEAQRERISRLESEVDAKNRYLQKLGHDHGVISEFLESVNHLLRCSSPPPFSRSGGVDPHQTTNHMDHCNSLQGIRPRSHSCYNISDQGLRITGMEWNADDHSYAGHTSVRNVPGKSETRSASEARQVIPRPRSAGPCSRPSSDGAKFDKVVFFDDYNRIDSGQRYFSDGPPLTNDGFRMIASLPLNNSESRISLKNSADPVRAEYPNRNDDIQIRPSIDRAKTGTGSQTQSNERSDTNTRCPSRGVPLDSYAEEDEISTESPRTSANVSASELGLDDNMPTLHSAEAVVEEFQRIQDEQSSQLQSILDGHLEDLRTSTDAVLAKYSASTSRDNLTTDC